MTNDTTTQVLPSTRGGHLLPADITAEQANLHTKAVNTFDCPQTGLVHATSHCNKPCSSQCQHDQHHGLVRRTHMFRHVEGNLCECAQDLDNGIARQLGDELRIATNIGEIIEGLQGLLDDIDHSLTRQAHTETEAGLIRAATDISWGEGACQTSDKHRQFTRQITTTFTNARRRLAHQRSRYEQQVGRDTLSRRMLACAAVNTQLHGRETIEQTDQMAADLHTLRQVTNHSDWHPVDIIQQLRVAWLNVTTRAEPHPDDLHNHVQTKLAELVGQQPNIETVANEYIRRWNQTADMLWLRHTGRPRLVAANTDMYSRAGGRYHGWRAVRGFIAQAMPIAQRNTDWVFLIIDEPAVVGMAELTVDVHLVDCGPARQLHQAAEQQNVDINDVLQLLTKQHADNHGTTCPDKYEMMRDAAAAINALGT